MTETGNPDLSSAPLEQEGKLATRLGMMDGEDEAGHLRRVAEELGGANSSLIARLKETLETGGRTDQMAAAARLGAMGERHATAVLRSWLESQDPEKWEVSVHGLRQSRDRSGWLCLESVALDHVESLSEPGGVHAFRLLVMGRTKTMDRLFRATDGHSRSISATAAKNFANIAVRSVPPDMSKVMAMRLGLTDHSHSTPEAVADACGLSIEDVRRLESLAWETVQRPRAYAEIMKWFGGNSD